MMRSLSLVGSAIVDPSQKCSLEKPVTLSYLENAVPTILLGSDAILVGPTPTIMLQESRSAPHANSARSAATARSTSSIELNRCVEKRSPWGNLATPFNITWCFSCIR